MPKVKLDQSVNEASTGSVSKSLVGRIKASRRVFVGDSAGSWEDVIEDGHEGEEVEVGDWASSSEDEDVRFEALFF